MPYTADSYALPFAGRSPRQRQNSYAAAIAQRPVRGVKKLRLLAYLKRVGRATDMGMADGLSLPIQSVCSLRNSLVSAGLVVDVDTAVGRFGKRVTVYAVTGEAQP
jgi:hypothetical protein